MGKDESTWISTTIKLGIPILKPRQQPLEFQMHRPSLMLLG
jgi:hypothetical protein